MRRLALLVGLIVLATAGAAVGDAGLVKDGDDTPGRLDVREIRHGHGTRKALIRHRVSMRSEWGTRLLRKKGAGELYLLFSTRGNDCVEKRVRIAKRDGELVAAVQSFDPLGCGQYDDSGGMSNFVRIDAEIDRRRGRDVIVVFSKDVLRKNIDSYTWSAATTLKSRRCSGDCVDHAPDSGEGVRGVLVHDLN